MARPTINPANLAPENTMAPQAPVAPAAEAPPVAENNTPAAVAAATNSPVVADTLGPVPSNPNVQLDEAEKIAGAKKGDKLVVHNPNIRPMRDPHTKDFFPAGEHVRVKEAGNWTIMQIGAGILKIGDPELVGEKPKKDEDTDA